MGQTNVKCYYY